MGINMHAYRYILAYAFNRGFPNSSVGKESACNAGDPSSIPGSGRSPGEGKSYSLQYSWASLVFQLVKNPPAMQETWVRSLGWEDLLEKEMAIHPVLLPGKSHGRRAWWAVVHAVAKSWTRLRDFTFTMLHKHCKNLTTA